MKELFAKKDTNIVKGVAIIFLMIHHCFLSPARYKNMELCFPPLTEDSLNYLAAFLKICVGIFVFLTAYGITISLKNKNTNLQLSNNELVKYSLSRYIKLFSGWILTFFLCEIFCLAYTGEPISVYGGLNLYGLTYLIIDGLGLANLFGTPTLVGTWWYMSLAFTLIFIIPLLIKIYNKIGILYLTIVFSFLVRYLNLTGSKLIYWMPAVILGIWFADNNLIVKLANYKIVKNKYVFDKTLKFILGLFIILACIKFRQSGISYLFFEIKDGVIPAIIIVFVYEFISNIKYLNTILEFIGKHSMNIFLIHTIIRANCFRAFIYSFKYPIIIVLVLLAISLLISIIIEYFKRITKYNIFIDKLIKRVIVALKI